MTRILIENGVVLTGEPDVETIHRGYLVIEDDIISKIGAGDPPDAVSRQAGEILDASDSLVMPGMVNAHIHFGDSFIRGLLFINIEP